MSYTAYAPWEANLAEVRSNSGRWALNLPIFTRAGKPLAKAITDRVLERARGPGRGLGRFIRLRGPSYRTRHLKDAEKEVEPEA